MLKKLQSWGRRPGLDFRGLQAVTHRRRILEEILGGSGAANRTSDQITAKGTKTRSTNRGIRRHILSDTGSIADLAMEMVLINTVRRSRLADMASAAGEHQLVVDTILLRVEQVGAIKSQRDVLEP